MKIRHFIIFVSLSLVVTNFSYQSVSAQQQIYYVYADPLPDYATGYASNAIIDATNAWQNANPNLKFYITNNVQQADLDVQWIKDWGGATGVIGEEISGHTIFVGLGDSGCMGSWQPYSSITVTHIAEHEIGHFLGLGHSADPNSVMYPTTQIQYGTVTWQKNLDTGYAWFVPICTQQSVSSFAYTVSLNNQNEAFDVYFVPSVDELNRYTNNEQFQYYQGNGCSGTNWVSYNGFCQGVSQGSGLLIATHGHILINHLITITATLTEQGPGQYSNIPALAASSTNSPSANNEPNFSWVGIIIVVGAIGVGLAAMRYALKSRH